MTHNLDDLLSVATNTEATYIVSVERAGSARKAAEALGVHHSVVSRAIARAAGRVPRQRSGKHNEHVWIPDTQLRPEVPTDHLVAAANYIAHKQPTHVIIGGDWWDMPSLNSYEKKGAAFFEGRDYGSDVEFGNDHMEEFIQAIRRPKGYDPEIHFLFGNHEYRIIRALESDPVSFRGAYSLDHLRTPRGVHRHNFLEVLELDGIMYSHYFVNPQSLIRGVLGGSIDNRLNKLKTSFTQGHQQILLTGSQYTTTGRRIRGCVAGAFYQHEEAYQGPQGQNYWRGIVYKHEVSNGDYDLMEVSLNYLLREWT